MVDYYSRSSTFKNLSVAFACQVIERIIRDRPLLAYTGSRTDTSTSFSKCVYEVRPYYFRGEVWSEGFEDRGTNGRVIKLRDEKGSSHTCWNNYWVYDLSSGGLVPSKVNAQSCKSGQGSYCNEAEITVDLVLGEMEKIDIELSLGSVESARRLFGVRIPNMGRQQIL